MEKNLNNTTIIDQVDVPALISIPLGLIGFLLNITILGIFNSSQRLKDPMYVLIGNVLVGDCLSSLQLVALGSAPFYLSNVTMQVADIFCKILIYTLYSTYNLSVFSLTAISIYRFKSTSQVTTMRSTKSRLRYAYRAITITWALSWILSFPVIFLVNSNPYTFGSCDIVYILNKEYLSLIYFVSATTVTYVIPLLIMLFNYGSIIRQLLYHVNPCCNSNSSKELESQQQISVIKLLLTVTATFMIFTCPFFIAVDFLASYRKTFYQLSIENHSIYLLCFFALPMTTFVSILNPTLYIACDKFIRNEIKRILYQFFCYFNGERYDNTVIPF